MVISSKNRKINNELLNKNNSSNLFDIGTNNSKNKLANSVPKTFQMILKLDKVLRKASSNDYPHTPCIFKLARCNCQVSCDVIGSTNKNREAI